MIIYQDPVFVDRYDYLFNHLDCSCIADKSSEDATGKVYILACSESKKENVKLKQYFNEMGYGKKYVILHGIDSREVNSIDLC